MNEVVKPGTIGLSVIPGLLGRLISLGQWVIRRPSLWTHAFIVVDDERVIQAMPSGVEYRLISDVLEDNTVVWLHDWFKLTGHQEMLLQGYAIDAIGKRYGFSDYLSLAIPMRMRPKWLSAYIAGNERFICSQLVDHLANRIGVELFADGRASQDVIPADLANQYLKDKGRARVR